MNTYLFAWAMCATVGAFVVLAVVIALEVRDRNAVPAVAPAADRAPRFTIQRRTPPAAVVVLVRDVEGFEAFLRELIETPHVEEALR